MANRMKFSFDFFLIKDINSDVMNALEVIFNDSGNRTKLPDAEFFYMEEWELLFCRYNGYPQYLKEFILVEENSQYYIKVNIENRENRYLLNKFFEWIIPFIDISKLKSSNIGFFENDSSFKRYKLKINNSKLYYEERPDNQFSWLDYDEDIEGE